MDLHVIGLDKKMVNINHKITKEEFIGMKMPQQAFENGVHAELIRQLAVYVHQNLPIKQTGNQHYFQWDVKGYVMTERDMMNLLHELVTMDDQGREMIANSCIEWLGL